jgi:ABC-type sugar transport system ATPase subunit
VASLQDVSKRFGRTVALDGVTLDLEAGEVHVVAGENGAGKSTLMKILAGVIQPDAGQIRIAGETVVLSSPAAARRSGIATIHQELSLVGAMSVVDNLLLDEGGRWWSWLRRDERRARVHGVLALVGLSELDVDTPVERLPLAARQLLEIARALAREARVIIMDEPTSALGGKEVEQLFERIDHLRREGTAMVFISHRMEEIERIADRISVLRDGALVANRPATEMSRDSLVEAMIGRRLSDSRTGAAAASGEALLEVQRLAAMRDGRTSLRGISLSLTRGEILGVAGLQGSGIDVLPLALFGGVPRAGSVSLSGVALPASPRAAIEAGMLLLSGDREHGLVQDLSVLDNAALSSLCAFSRRGWMDDEALREALNAMATRVHLDAPSLDAPVRQLSGGNQQKVALLRCLMAKPRLLLLDDATRGIDVGAKRDVFALVRELASQGMGLLVTSSDAGELVELCQRVVVLRRGKLVRELTGDAIRRDAILHAALSDGDEVAA